MTVNSEVQVKLMEVAGPVRKRRTVRIDREETRWKVDLDRVSDIGFSATAAAKARRDFAALLMKIGKRIAPKAPKASSLPSDPDAVVETVKEALRLSDAELRDVKYPLRDIGLELYKSLSSEMRVALGKQGILTTPEDREEDLALTFILEDNTTEARSPICWNMIYQADNPDPIEMDWENFWGFRFPISQWIYMSRRADLHLSSAIGAPSAFVAIDPSLPFTHYEQSLLVNQFPKNHTNFEQLIDDYAYSKLKARVSTHSAEAEEIDNWWRQNKENKRWLSYAIERLFPDPDERQAMSGPWKQAALKHIFQNSSYALIHFACHCQSRKSADPTVERRMLSLLVGGEPFPIDDQTMTNFMTRKKREEWHPDDDGPFVFLNACASGAQIESQFPDLPQEWIHGQGAKAVIATICDVPDVFGFAFAAKLYATLFDALDASRKQTQSNGYITSNPTLYIAQALLQTRRYFLTEFNNPMGLAYELFAVPEARLIPT